jgi:hypothetical protein
MAWPVILGVGAVAVAGYEIVRDLFFKKKLAPAPHSFVPGVVSPTAPIVVSQQPVMPHKVPGGTYVYTAPQAAPDVLQTAATQLAALNPCDASSEQAVRNFQAAAGLAQLNGGAGWNAVNPPGTDGRYGHDVAALLSKYVSHAPAPCSPRPSWWGPPGTYKNRT